MNERPGRLPRLLLLGALTGLPSAVWRAAGDEPAAFIRVSQVGYSAGGVKSAVVLSTRPLQGTFQLVDAATGDTVFEGRMRSPQSHAWGSFPYHAVLDFSSVRRTGRFLLRLAGGRAASPAFAISPDAYSELPDQLLEFMRQQRCGYNPFLDIVCHPFDGRTAFAPSPDGTYLDARGGWGTMPEISSSTC